MRTFAQKKMSTQQTSSANPKTHMRLLQANSNGFESSLAWTTSNCFAHDFSKISSHPHECTKIHPKLKVSTSEDIFEQEADRVAVQVMNMAPPIQRQTVNGVKPDILTKPLVEEIMPIEKFQGLSEEAKRVRTKCRACEKKEQIQQLNLESRLDTCNGSPLPDRVRSFMEPRFGTDFGMIRVHTDGNAARMNQELNAQAFTYRQDIYFGAGRFPDNNDLTAHELTHVVQQSGAAQRGTGPIGAIIQRMIACPPRLADDESIPSGWRPYVGDPNVFHCGFRGILEDRAPTLSDPMNECFYDHSGALVDENHPYAGCRGTPDYFDSRDQFGLPHALVDPGGIVVAGVPAFITSRIYDLMQGIASAIQIVSTAGRIIQSVADGLGESVALGVLTARASVDPGNWSFQGLPARSVRHLNMMGAIIGSAALSRNVDTLLRNLTRRLDSFSIAGLLDELAQDINQALRIRGMNMQVTSVNLGALSLIQLVDWLQVQGIVQYLQRPEEIARAQLTAQRAATPEAD